MREQRTRTPEDAGSTAVQIAIDRGTLNGDLVVPQNAIGIVLFAHGSGSSRRSPRNRFVARELQRARLGTLLMDLLTEREEAQEAAGSMRRFDIEMLAERLSSASDWLTKSARTSEFRVGYFGASTGAAAALMAAAERPERVGAVVSRGGRPDLASPETLARVRAPTLLLVGSRDVDVLELNRQAYESLRCTRKLEVVRGATHLFEEPGTLEQVAQHARDWFVRHLADTHASAGFET